MATQNPAGSHTAKMGWSCAAAHLHYLLFEFLTPDLRGVKKGVLRTAMLPKN